MRCWLFWAGESYLPIYTSFQLQHLLLFFSAAHQSWKACRVEKNVVRRMQILKYADMSLVSHMLVKSKVNIFAVMWGPNFTFFVCVFPKYAALIAFIYFSLFCSVLLLQMFVDVVVKPDWLNNPLLRDDHCMGFTCSCGDVLDDEP